jgi:glyoxylase-like metal-dependent hydrolase (beta-lactamase superfamily II)
MACGMPVLVDAFMTVKQANPLAEWVAARGKNLTTIYITHGHGDHWFGVGALVERFPNARAVATPNAEKVMRQNASPEVLEEIWRAAFPDQIPDKLVIAEELEGKRSRSLRQDARAVPEPGQSRVGALEFGTRSQALNQGVAPLTAAAE